MCVKFEAAVVLSFSCHHLTSLLSYGPNHSYQSVYCAICCTVPWPCPRGWRGPATRPSSAVGFMVVVNRGGWWAGEPRDGLIHIKASRWLLGGVDRIINHHRCMPLHVATTPHAISVRPSTHPFLPYLVVEEDAGGQRDEPEKHLRRHVRKHARDPRCVYLRVYGCKSN